MRFFCVFCMMMVLFGIGCRGASNEVTELGVDMNNDWNAGVYSLDIENSIIEWIGRGAGRRHNGEVDFSYGELVVSSSGPENGVFVVNMGSLRSLDMGNERMRLMLDDHLKDEDFFNVEEFGEAVLVLDEIRFNEDGKLLANGEIEIRGVSRELVLDNIEMRQLNDDMIWAKVFFQIDRTDFNIRYGSGRFFQNLGDSLIRDEVEFGVELILIR